MSVTFYRPRLLCSSQELEYCTACVSRHHSAQKFYEDEYVEEVVRPVLATLRRLDEERVAATIKRLRERADAKLLSAEADGAKAICCMFEVIGFINGNQCSKQVPVNFIHLTRASVLLVGEASEFWKFHFAFHLKGSMYLKKMFLSCLSLQIFTYPKLLDDDEIFNGFGPLLRLLADHFDLSLSPGQRYPVRSSFLPLIHFVVVPLGQLDKCCK